MEVKRHGFSEYTRFEEALEEIFSRIKQVPDDKVSFSSSCGRVLSEDIESGVNVPPFDRSAMDGFAVRAEDTFGADENDPKKLDLIGSVGIGSKTDLKVSSGEAVEIATGASIPIGADAVVMLEKTKLGDSNVEIYSPVTPGKNVSSEGEDVKEGQLILGSGHRIRPWDVGMLASTGNLEVEVKVKPKVALASTGGELREPGEKLDLGEITESNTYSLGAAVEANGGEFVRLGIVPDRVEKIKEVLDQISDFNLFLFTGGTSVGEKDLVPDVISEMGELIFHGVNVRPGGPIAFGMVKETPVFSLPGFPAAAVIDFEVFVRPAMRAMLGLSKSDFRPRIKGKLVRKIRSTLGRVDVCRVKVWKDEGEYMVEPIRVTGSSILRTMTEADGIVMVPRESEGFSENVPVDVELFDY